MHYILIHVLWCIEHTASIELNGTDQRVWMRQGKSKSDKNLLRDEKREGGLHTWGFAWEEYWMSQVWTWWRHGPCACGSDGEVEGHWGCQGEQGQLHQDMTTRGQGSSHGSYSDSKNPFHTTPKCGVRSAPPYSVGIPLSFGGVIQSTYPWLQDCSLGNVIWATGCRDMINLKQQ